MLWTATLSIPDTIAHDVLDRLRGASRKGWVVYAKRPFAGAQQVYRYLGRYTHRVGISNSRMIAIDGDHVRFHTKGGKALRIRGVEFVRRFALHVLPKGFTRLRHYGLLAPAHVNTTWHVANALLTPGAAAKPVDTPSGDETVTTEPEEAEQDDPGERWHPPLCPRCRCPMAHSARDPPPDEDSS
jgi:hypothetical protein